MRRLAPQPPHLRRSGCAAPDRPRLPPWLVVGVFAGAALGLWLLLTASLEGLAAAARALLVGLVALGLLATLVTLVAQTRRLARQITTATATDEETGP